MMMTGRLSLEYWLCCCERNNRKTYLIQMKPTTIYITLLISLLAACTPTEKAAYLHIAHTRSNKNIEVLDAVKNLNYSNYDMLWLGGDMAIHTSEDDATMQLMDELFDLDHPNTLWSLGNHDNTDLERVQRFTQRPTYYSHHHNGITFLVLDTQDSLSNIVGKQQVLVNSVLDTIQASSHLVILHHKLIWMLGHPELEEQIPDVTNGGTGATCVQCINPNNFYTDIYHKLVKVKKRGVEVICVGGDIGFKAKEFDYQTKEGIHFLASGIADDTLVNKVLIFQHDLDKQKLIWAFKNIEELN